MSEPLLKFRAAFLVVIFLVAAVAGFAAPARILFVGNSYTNRNNLPEVLRDIAVSAGEPAPVFKASMPKGQTLMKHLHLPETLKLIDVGGWDFVILQGQSEESAMAEVRPDIRENFLQGAAGLYDRIKAKSPHATVVFYQTWARHADYWKDPKADLEVGHNANEMQKRIRTWYQLAAQREGSLIAAVGDAWQLNYQRPNPIRLHNTDNSHPIFSGTYLAASVIYATIYNPAELKFAYRGPLSKDEASTLQALARQVTATKPAP